MKCQTKSNCANHTPVRAAYRLNPMLLWTNTFQSIHQSVHLLLNDLFFCWRRGYVYFPKLGIGVVRMGPGRLPMDEILSLHCFFPTCQVRVVRFYQSCSPRPPPAPPPPLPPPPVSPRPCLHQLPRPLPPCQLVANLFANCRAQWALLDLNCRLPIWVGTAGPQPPGSERSGHRWTSVPTAVGTAGPQPGTFRAQWAPLDLNLGPSELSGHRWTSAAR